MAIPTLKAFDALIAALGKCACTELTDDMWALIPSDSQSPPNQDDVVLLLHKWAELRDKKREGIYLLPAWKWFVSNPKVNEVRSSLSTMRGKKLAPLSDEQRSALRRETASHILSPSRTGDCGVEHVAHVRRKLERFLRRNFCGWELGVFSALRDYYYTEKWELLYNESRSLQKHLSNAIDALNALANLSFSEIHRSMRISRISKSVEGIEELQKLEAWKTYPVRRRDDTSRDRQLIYDLYKNNMRNLGSPRIRVIYDLLSLEGINAPIDQRNIELMISKWRGSFDEFSKRQKEALQNRLDESIQLTIGPR